MSNLNAALEFISTFICKNFPTVLIRIGRKFLTVRKFTMLKRIGTMHWSVMKHVAAECTEYLCGKSSIDSSTDLFF